jgi:hypothetical protein
MQQQQQQQLEEAARVLCCSCSASNHASVADTAVLGMAGSGPGPLQGIWFILHVLV